MQKLKEVKVEIMFFPFMWSTLFRCDTCLFGFKFLTKSNYIIHHLRIGVLFYFYLIFSNWSCKARTPYDIWVLPQGMWPYWGWFQIHKQLRLLDPIKNKLFRFAIPCHSKFSCKLPFRVLESELWCTFCRRLHYKSMIGENRQLVTNEPVEFEK